MESQFNQCVFKIDEVVQVNQFINLYENVSYQIKFQTEEQRRNSQSSELYRSYSHFEWLARNMMDLFEGMIVPQIPGKNPLAKLKLIDSQTRSIREQRKIGLEEFLKKIVAHPQFQTSECLANFLLFSEKEINDLKQNKFGQIYQSISQNQIVKSGIQKSLNVIKLFMNSDKSLHQQQNKLQLSEYDISSEEENLFQEEQQSLQNMDMYLINIVDLLKNILESRQSVINNSSQVAENIGNLQKKSFNEEQKDQEVYLCQITSNIPQIIEKEIQISSENLNQLSYIIYAIEMYLLDVKYGLSIIDKKNEIQSEIKIIIDKINGGEETVEAVQTLQTQLNELKDRLIKISSNFKKDIEYFKKTTEEGINKLVVSFNQIHIKILQAINYEMNESQNNSNVFQRQQ